MSNKKGLKYYIVIFIISVLAILGYLVINNFQGNDLELSYTISLFFVPLVFTFALFAFDRLIDIFIPKKKELIRDGYEQFVIEVTELLRSDDSFEIEDFKKLRENDRFQRVLKQIYNIRTQGETADSNYKMVHKRFKKDTLEHKAVSKIIE